MSIFTVDVGFSDSFPVRSAGDGWHRFWVEAEDGTTAELTACQMTASHPGRTPVWSVVVDWPTAG